MKYRTVDILAGADQTDGSGTKTIDINLKDVISRIRIYWQVTMAGEGMNSYQHKDIPKIELVNGSDVLHGLDGGQNQALCILDRKIPTMNYKQKLGSNSLASNYGIDFGRFLHDPMLALDPKRFDQLQLKITYNEAVADTGATVNELQVKAEVFDQKQVSPVGFLQAKEIYNATTPASGYTYLQLPRDHTLRKLLVQGYRSAYEPWNQVANARLSEDSDKRVPFDWNIERYYRMMQSEWTPVVDEFFCYGQGASATNLVYVTPTDYWVTQSYSDYGGNYSAVGASGGRGGKLAPISAATIMCMGIAKGYLPNHCIEFPFGDPQDLDDWYDLADVGSLELRLNAGGGGSSGSHAVVVQQLRRY